MPVSEVVEIRARFDALDLSLDAASGSGFPARGGPGLCALLDLYRVEVQVGGATGEASDCDAAYSDLLTSFWV